jgi:hypothetical protein
MEAACRAADEVGYVAARAAYDNLPCQATMSLSELGVGLNLKSEEREAREQKWERAIAAEAWEPDASEVMEAERKAQAEAVADLAARARLTATLAALPCVATLQEDPLQLRAKSVAMSEKHRAQQARKMEGKHRSRRATATAASQPASGSAETAASRSANEPASGSKGQGQLMHGIAWYGQGTGPQWLQEMRASAKAAYARDAWHRMAIALVAEECVHQVDF